MHTEKVISTEYFNDRIDALSRLLKLVDVVIANENEIEF